MDRNIGVAGSALSRAHSTASRGKSVSGSDSADRSAAGVIDVGAIVRRSRDAGRACIRLATPTTNDARRTRILANTSGFLYYVSITGITGAARVDPHHIRDAVARLRRQTALPIAVGFGVKSAEDARDVAAHADAVVVGTAIVDRLAAAVGADPVGAVSDFVADLAAGIRGAAHAA